MPPDIYSDKVYLASVYWFGKTDLDSLCNALDKLQGGHIPEYLKLLEDLRDYL